MAQNPIRYREDFEPESPLVAIALKLAKQAHQGQMRGKADSSIPYIVHPVMVHDLLKEFGVDDEITLAVALLHDALEDCERYQDAPEKMAQDIWQELVAAGYRDATEIAHYITDTCMELTNAPEMPEGKRNWQVEHVGKISRRAALVKIVDQTASELDRVMMANAPEWEDKDRSRAWSYKALNVVKAAQEGREYLRFWGNFHKVLFQYSMQVTNAPTPQAAQQLREAFDFDESVELAHRMKEGVDVAVKAWVEVPQPATLAAGLVAVGMDEQGKVCSYACLTNPEGGRDDTRNKAGEQLVGGLEASETMRRVTIGERRLVGGRLARVNKVKPEMDARDFCRVAHAAGAISMPMQIAVRDSAHQLEPSRRR